MPTRFFYSSSSSHHCTFLFSLLYVRTLRGFPDTGCHHLNVNFSKATQFFDWSRARDFKTILNDSSSFTSIFVLKRSLPLMFHCLAMACLSFPQKNLCKQKQWLTQLEHLRTTKRLLVPGKVLQLSLSLSFFLSLSLFLSHYLSFDLFPSFLPKFSLFHCTLKSSLLLAPFSSPPLFYTDSRFL